jgi:PDZ domain-containing protein
MPRRAVVLVVTTALAVVMAAATLFIPVPYAAIAPGPTFNALGEQDNKPIVSISGHATATTDGQLRLVTVQVYGKPQRLLLGDVVRGWFDKTVAVVPINSIYPDSKTTQQQDAENATAMVDSQLEAKAAAMSALHIPLTVTVQDANKQFPAAAVLKIGDEIVSVDGTSISTIAALTQLMATHKPGDTVTVTYRRSGTEHTVPIQTVASPDDPKKAIIGITLGITLPFTVDIQLANVGGPSAGLMFSLAIYDKLSDGHLAGGRSIAGTGTIDAEGVVGPIGGIQQKVYAARRDGASVFLVPHANCADIHDVPKGLELVDVTSLADAVTDLGTLRSGGTPAGCAAGK